MYSAIRVANIAMRIKLNVMVTNVNIMYYTSDYRKIIFSALGKTFEFTAESNPCRFSKPKWKAQQLWKLTEITKPIF